jgi:hypothetical protein
LIAPKIIIHEGLRAEIKINPSFFRADVDDFLKLAGNSDQVSKISCHKIEKPLPEKY